MLQRNRQGSLAVTPYCLSTWAPVVLGGEGPGKARGVKSDYKDLRVGIRNYGLASLTVSPVKIMDQGPSEHISGPMKEKEVIRKSQHGFTKGQSCLNNWTARYDKMTGFMDKGKAMDDCDLAFITCQPLSKHFLLLT